ncbi:TnsA endonuclease N-terminal domain-containing protein [Comamonas testosteroni]|uniref:TnsA endonuclease N-terminal domain-containing protein n=1 Tax=Comamonas testosteroni TaxID=285 RepID=UPI00389A8872
MGKHVWSEKKIERMVKEGRGRGHGSSYRPWLEITDLSSLGRSRRVWSAKTNRIHHLFSDVEYHIFLAAEWSRSVLDIREQYPLDRDLTQSIAHELQIPHPTYPGTHVPVVMTVDFLLTICVQGKTTCVAINAKVDEEAEDARSIEKLEIQRSYFEVAELQHHLLYRSRIPKEVVNNLDWIRNAQLEDGELEDRPGFFESLKTAMSRELSRLANASTSLWDYCNQFDAQHGMRPGTGLRVARMLIQERCLMANLKAQDLAREPLSSFVTTSRAGQIRAVAGL